MCHCTGKHSAVFPVVHQLQELTDWHCVAEFAASQSMPQSVTAPTRLMAELIDGQAHLFPNNGLHSDPPHAPENATSRDGPRQTVTLGDVAVDAKVSRWTVLGGQLQFLVKTFSVTQPAVAPLAKEP